MNLIDLAEMAQLKPKKTSSHGGGEYHSSCPNCKDGQDRFAIWPNEKATNCEGRYWCRVCDVKGDAIQFCRDFLGLTFQNACKQLNAPIFEFKNQCRKKIAVPLKTSSKPAITWQDKAGVFIDWCHQQIFKNHFAMEKLYQRGFTEKSIRRFNLGYCPRDFWRLYSDWGLNTELKPNGKPKMIWLPHGLTLPWFDTNGKTLKINIRRLDWHEDDNYGKYIKIAGGMQCPAIYGDPSLKVGIILESEFDALLIQQEAGDFCFCIATGGSTQPLDIYTDHVVRKSPLIMFCPDIDQAGAKFLERLQKNYTNGVLWPAPLGKSPGDALSDHSVNLREWILQGLPDELKRQIQEAVYA